MLRSGKTNCICIQNLQWKPKGKVSHDVSKAHAARVKPYPNPPPCISSSIFCANYCINHSTWLTLPECQSNIVYVSFGK